jgi:phosphopentomutase
MRRAILLVLDGLGVGAMKDVPAVRPQDEGADSLRHALQKHPGRLPNLEVLGLGMAAPSAGLGQSQVSGSWGRSELGYPGADSYLGHQAMFGSDVSGVVLEGFAPHIDRYSDALRDAGHRVRTVDGLPVLAVDEAMVVCDSLEADPGMNYNVTGSLEVVDFSEIVEVARGVRALAPVPRVIAVGGREVGLEDIMRALKDRDGAVGVDTPSLGVYGNGVQLQHLGFRFATEQQTPSRVAEAGLPVALIGKMADLIACPTAQRLPGVDTGEVLGSLMRVFAEQEEGLIAANVQEVDLAGHQESAEMYVEVLESADRALGRIRDDMGPDDLLIVCGDHGNDPTRGRLHTREEVPLLAWLPGKPTVRLGTRSSLADVGATLADWLGVPLPPVGESFLELIR